MSGPKMPLYLLASRTILSHCALKNQLVPKRCMDK